MYALALNGSPRKGGNTEILLKRVLAPLQEAGWDSKIIRIGGKPMQGCIACYKCRKNKNLRCVLKDDAFNDIFARMLKADAIILGSPAYFSDVTAEMKALIDRAGFVAAGNNRALRAKIGVAVVALRRGGGIHAFDTMNHLFQISGMIIPGSTYWNMAYGQEKEEVLNDKEGMHNMQHLGQTINWLAQAIVPHTSSFPE